MWSSRGSTARSSQLTSSATLISASTYSATAEVRLQRGLELAVRLDQEIGFPIDVRVLNDAPVTFLFHVFREGRLLLSRNDECLADLMERTVREYLDAAPLLRQATIEAYGA